MSSLAKAMRFVLALTCCVAGGYGQAKIHTRDVTRLSQIQIAEFLKRSDVIFVAVGATEAQGFNPSDMEYIAPLGSAAQMAEEGDAVYLPNIAFMYPGSTITSAATLYMSIPASTAFLKEIARSLLRQGFRTQIWVWHGHGPSPLYVGAMCRDFFEEYHVPILAYDAATAERNFKGPKDKILYGKYALVGHIEDLPLAGEIPARPDDGARGASAEADTGPGYATLNKLHLAGSLGLGYWHANPDAHSAGGRGNLPKTPEERTAWGKEGMAQLAAVVKTMDVKTMIGALKQHDKFTQDVIVPKLGRMLPSPE
jgi:creatinine amidohydrolase